MVHLILPLLMVLATGFQAGETPAISDRHALGEIDRLDLGQNLIVLSTGAGIVFVHLQADTKALRIPPGETSLQKAETITLNDIAAGDRLLARGEVSADRKSIQADQVIVISRTALDEKRRQDKREWEERGIAGTVSSLDPTAREITLTMRSKEGLGSIVIQAGEEVVFRRYAPDSVKFADALPSSFDELKRGDQVRALGEKSLDGARFQPEIIVSGSFVMAGGTITSIDLQSNELTLADIQTQRPLTVVISKDSVLRRLPFTAARALAQPSAETAARQNGAGGNVQQILEESPAITVSDLQVGDMVLVSSTRGVDSSRVTAIVMAAGVEPLLRPRESSNAQRANTALTFGDFMDVSIGLPVN